MKIETTQIHLSDNQHSAIHRFRSADSQKPVFLLHGSIEDARVFYSKSGKGFAPFLAKHGFDVFAPDMAGRGNSEPRVSSGFRHSHADVINRDIPKYIEHIRQFYPDAPICMGAHSWGGVMILAWYVRYGSSENPGPMVFFGTKRHIATISLRRFLWVDVMWNAVGEITTAIRGYLPAKALKMGSQNEPAKLFRETKKWVYSKRWLDFNTDEDIAARLADLNLPPILYFAGANDKVLGHPADVKRLIGETGSKNAEFVLLSRANGYKIDYGHIDMLTSKHARSEQFVKAVEHFDITQEE